MASAPPASENRETDRSAETAALALLLLGAKRRYDLRAVIQKAGIRPTPFRRIAPTEALRSNIAAPYFELIRAWAAERDTLMRAYADARATGDASIIQRAIEQAASRIEPVLATVQRRFPAALANAERWHRAQWIARIKASTGLDVSMFTAASDVQPEVANAVAWNQQLATDVHRQIHGGVAAAFMGALAIRAASPSAQVNAVLAKAKRRSANIGVDQADKAGGGMTRARMAAAGLDRWKWRHLDPQPHPRPEHKVRDGRIYNVSNQPNDLPGVLPFCKCWTEPVLG